MARTSLRERSEARQGTQGGQERDTYRQVCQSAAVLRWKMLIQIRVIGAYLLVEGSL